MSNYEPQTGLAQPRFHEEKMAERPTISELANQLIELEGQIPSAVEQVDRARALLDEAETNVAATVRQQDTLCRRRNNILKELARYQMVEYEGDDK